MTIFLETKRLILKSPTLSDLNDWCAVHAESDVVPYSKEVVEKWLHQHIAEFKQYGFSMGSVFLKNSNEFVGRAGLFYSPDIIDPGSVEMGYVLHKKHWNQGYATELAHALLDWGFNHLKLEKIVALTRVDNKKSQHVLQKVGMKYVKQIQSEHHEFLLFEITNPSLIV